MTNLIIGKINSGKTRGILFNEFKKSIANKENLFQYCFELCSRSCFSPYI